MGGIVDLLTGNDSSAGSNYANQQRDVAAGFNPAVDAGNQARGALQGEYGKQINTPDFLENQLGSSWSASPYARAQERYVTQALNNNAAATGQLGSGYSARTMGQNLQDIFSADQNRYIDRGMNTYNQGISGDQQLTAEGLNALAQRAGVLTGANQTELAQNQANQTALTGLVGQGVGLAGTFASGGSPGAGGLIGGAGRAVLPTSITSMFSASPTSGGFASGYPAAAPSGGGGNGSGALQAILPFLMAGAAA